MRLIDADALKLVLVPGNPKSMVEAQVLNVIDKAPTVDAVEVVPKGCNWCTNEKYPHFECVRLDCDGHAEVNGNMVQAFIADYCPSCGAKMDKAVEG